MRRDMDLVRDLLTLAADAQGTVSAYALVDEGHSRELVAYHVRIMEQAGLVDAHVAPPGVPAPQSCLIKELTWEGQEFLSNVSSDAVWAKVKKGVSTAAGDASIEVFKALAVKLVSSLVMQSF